MNYLITHGFIHGLLALPFAYFIYHKTQSIRLGISVILMTYVLDVDHLVDYFLNLGDRFSLVDFFSLNYFYSGYARVPLHAWEWLVVCALLVYKKGWRSIFAVVLFGMIPHLIYDSLTINSFLKYSIIYRLSHGFYIP